MLHAKRATPPWDELRILLAVHRHKSFLAAGHALGLAPSTVARRIEALESALGRPVVYRGNDGARLYADALRLVALAEQVELGLAALVRESRTPELSGTVRISVLEGLVRVVLPIVARLQAKHPALHVELVAEARVANLARAEADIGLRIVPSTSASSVSKLLGRAATGLFAARDYLDRYLPGATLSRAHANQQAWVGFESSLEHLAPQAWLKAYGASRFVLRSNSSLAVEHAVLAGMGIGVLTVFQARGLPGVVQLELDAPPPPPIPLYLAFHRDAKKTLRLRTVLKELETELRRQLA